MRDFSTGSKRVHVVASDENREHKNDASARHAEDKLIGEEVHSVTKRSCFAHYGYREAAKN